MCVSGCGTDRGRNAPFPDTATKTSPLRVGDNLPDVVLGNMDGNEVRLKAVVAGQPALIVFYRGGWCPYCNTHLSELSGIEKKLKEQGIQVIAISPDHPGELVKSMDKHHLGYTLLSDSTMNAARAFGVGFEVDAQTLLKYKGYGIDLESASGQQHHALPVPSVFLVGGDGKVRFSHSNPDYKVRLSGQEILDAATSLRF
ncbi:MAG: peroxiredoxin-like family protein [Planctomycetota bacterium]